MTPLVLATANVQCDLPAPAAAQALTLVLDRSPDLVGLQEWSLRRLPLLRRRGRVRLLAGRASVPLPGSGDYGWIAPVVGGCAVGWRAERYTLVRARSVVLSLPGRADRGETPLGLEPGRVATLVTLRDRSDGRMVSLVDYHLVYGVQRGAGYRTDRPVLVRRHQTEREVLERLVDTLLRRGHEVHALGDSNFAGLTLPGLTSAWAGPGGATASPRRAIDDVFGPGVPLRTELVTTPSDHAAVVVTRAR